MANTYILYSDGGARGNPGPAASAAILLNEEGQVADFISTYHGENTNNFAEYSGLISGLKVAEQRGVKQLKCYLDSELIVMQVNGAYRVKQPQLKELWEQVEALKKAFTEIKFIHVRREENKLADKLVNLTLDAAAAA